MPPTNLWLIRHGESTANAGIWHHSVKDILLTGKGKEQVRKIIDEIPTEPNLLITSPFQRALDSAAPIQSHWPSVEMQIWPIEEFVYLSPSHYWHKTPAERRQAINDYWEKCDPDYCDGSDAESFTSFMERVKNFHERIMSQNGFVIVVGHGQFFKAYLLGLADDFLISPEWMRFYRMEETHHPIKNGEIIKL